MVRYAKLHPTHVRRVVAFRGYWMIISLNGGRAPHDAPGSQAVFPAGACVLTTSDHDRVALVKPWRYKRNGVFYGSYWVCLTDNKGKRKYLKLEELAITTFGDLWVDMKRRIKEEDLRTMLAELH